jgi:CelD/BcsL family acetyltransferase involved in cellulose biosynthesis
MDFYVAVLKSNVETVRPYVIVVDREGKPDAILIGRIDHRKVDFRVGYLQFSSAAAILYFVNGALRGNCSDENSRLLLDEVSRSLSRGEADAAYLNVLATDSNIYRSATEPRGFLTRDHIKVSQPHFGVRLPSTADEFYNGLSSKTRWQVRSKSKKFTAAFPGKIEIRCFRQCTDLNEMIQDVERVAKKSYQRGLGVGFMESSAVRERLQFSAANGWLMSYVLYIEQQPVGFWVGSMNEGTFVSDYLGYDPQFAMYSPGTYLVLKVIEKFCVEGVSEVDFGPGYAQYKQVLGNREWQESAVYIFSRSIKGMRLNALRHLTGWSDNAIRRALTNAKVLPRVKKAWRDRLQHRQNRDNEA